MVLCLPYLGYPTLVPKWLATVVRLCSEAICPTIVIFNCVFNYWKNDQIRTQNGLI